MINTKLAALTAAAFLVVPAAAGAKKPEQPSKGKQESQAKKQAKPVSFVLKGIYNADGTVAVTKGNGHAKRADLVGETLTFDFSAAKLSVADVNQDGKVDLTDVQAGDKVVVKVRAPRSTTAADTLRARQLVDQTHPAADEVEAPEQEATPAA